MIRTLAGLAPFQLAFVVRDLETAAQRFDAVLGAGPWRGYLFDEAAVGGRLYHGRPADWSLRLALNNTRPQYELIQPIAGPSIHAEWLARATRRRVPPVNSRRAERLLQRVPDATEITRSR